jgi:hypothetical protein
MKIIVTQMDIQKAEENRVNFAEAAIIKAHPLPIQACPIYQACSRKFKNKLIGVSLRYIWLKDGTAYLLPQSAVEFVMDFDSKTPVKPFEFEATKCD